MKNITLSAEEKLIEKARKKAMEEHTSLNERFRVWLKQYVGTSDKGSDYMNFMNQHSTINSGRHFSREEMNER